MKKFLLILCLLAFTGAAYAEVVTTEITVLSQLVKPINILKI